MLRKDDPVLIHPDWFKEMIAKYGPEGLEVRCIVECRGAIRHREWDAHPIAKTPGTRWVQVRGEDSRVQYTVPEHFLNRPSPNEGKAPQYESEWRRKQEEAPVVRNTPDDLTKAQGSIPRGLPAQLRTGLSKMLTSCEIDWRGHFCNGTEWNSDGWYRDESERRKEMLTSDLLGYSANSLRVSEDDVRALVEAHEKGEPLDRWIPIVRANHYDCPNCAETSFRSALVFESNGVIIRPTSECPCPDGLTTEWEQNFPSGKMLIGNDFRFMTRLPDNRDINCRYGTHLQILDYAQVGLALGFGIGNSSPSVYKMADGSLEIGSKSLRVWWVPEGTEGAIRYADGEDNPRWYVTEQPADRQGEYDKYGDTVIDALPDGCESVASICTDLWAYSIIDLDEGRKRALHSGMSEEDWEKFIDGRAIEVDVEPGKYRFQHYHAVNRDNPSCTFARIERVGDAEPCFDYCKAVDEFDVHLSQAVQIKTARRRGEDNPDEGISLNVQDYANYMGEMVRGCIPNRDWHPSGFPNDFMFTDIVGVPIKEIPRLHGAYYSNYDVGAFGTQINEICTLTEDQTFGGIQPLNNSHALGMGRLLESIISYGLKTNLDTHEEVSDWKADPSGATKIPNPNYGTYNVRECLMTMMQAIVWWVALVKHYPHVAEDMADFAQWMANRNAVTLWVSYFNLGPEKFDRAAEDARVAAQEAASQSKALQQWIVDRPGIKVLWDGREAVVSQKEGSPDHCIIEFDGVAGLEVPLSDLTLSDEAEAERVAARLYEKILARVRANRI